MKKVVCLFFISIFSFCLFCGENSFIKITNFEDQHETYIYNREKCELDEPMIFEGQVSEDCVSIRVIWAPKKQDLINEYLLNKKAIGYKVDDYTLKNYKAGDTTFIYKINGNLDNLEFGTNCYRFIAKFSDGSYKTYSTTLFVRQGGFAEKGKPVIYLYPTKTQTVKVEVKPEGGLTVSDPEYKKGWKVKATPEGVITDLKTKKEYPYLFWESKDNPAEIDMSKGFVSAVADLENFFTEKLTTLGLNKKEIADFNEFWIPSIKAEGKDYVFVTFYSQKRIDEEAPLSILPVPDSVIRVYFDHKVLDEPIEVAPQDLTANERKGFAVVEWGGRLYK